MLPAVIVLAVPRLTLPQLGYHISGLRAVCTANSLSNIPAGTYTVTITNSNGCSASASTIVQNSNGANITTSSLPVTCFGASDGSASVTATGGSGTYTYAWSGGGSSSSISGKPAGSCTVTVSDGSSCSATASITIWRPVCSSFSKCDIHACHLYYSWYCYGQCNGRQHRWLFIFMEQ
jgi:hypothetical protein